MALQVKFMMISTKDEVGVLKNNNYRSMGALRKRSTPDGPDVVRVALVRIRWGADVKEND